MLGIMENGNDSLGLRVVLPLTIETQIDKQLENEMHGSLHGYVRFRGLSGE